MSHTTALRRRAPRLLATITVLVLAGVLAACGDDTGASDSSPDASGSSSAPSAATGTMPETITVKGKFGESPDVSWSGPVEVTDLAATAVIEGDGATLAAGDNVLAHLWVGDGTTQKEGFSSFTATPPTPQAINLGAQTLPAIVKGLIGATVGSRVLIAAPPADAFGDAGNPELGIANLDTVVFIVDVLNSLAGPDGETRDPAAWAPVVTESDGDPTGLDFSAAPKPSGKLQRTTLIQGTGPKTTKGQHLFVDYLGQVYGADAPFDQSYERGQPFDFDLGAGNVVKGWDQGLVGVPIGSRVILQIPPKLGYGKAGQPSVDIKGTDTMYFIVDVLAAT